MKRRREGFVGLVLLALILFVGSGCSLEFDRLRSLVVRKEPQVKIGLHDPKPEPLWAACKKRLSKGTKHHKMEFPAGGSICVHVPPEFLLALDQELFGYHIMLWIGRLDSSSGGDFLFMWHRNEDQSNEGGLSLGLNTLCCASCQLQSHKTKEWASCDECTRYFMISQSRVITPTTLEGWPHPDVRIYQAVCCDLASLTEDKGIPEGEIQTLWESLGGEFMKPHVLR